MRLTTCILTLCAFLSVLGQDPYYIAINKSKGLPSNAVYDMYQDTKGFFWFATDEGLCRYDGKNFKSFISPVVTSRSGTNIHEDRYGRIWYTNFDNHVYYIENGEIKSIDQNKTPGNFYKYHLLSNCLFLLQERGVDIYDLSSLNLVKTIEFENIRSTSGDNTGFYVLDDYNDIYRIDTTLRPVRISRTKEMLIASNNGSIFFGNKGQSNASFEECTKKRDIIAWNFNYPEFISNIVFADDQMWVCTKNGVYRKSPNAETGYEQFFKGRYVSFVLEDKDHNIWISTVNEGVLFIPNFHNRFYTFENFTPQIIRIYNNDIYLSGKNNSIQKLDVDQVELSQVYDGKNSHEITCFEMDTLSGHLLVCSDMLHNIFKGSSIMDCNLPVKAVTRVDRSYYAYAASGSCGLHKIDVNAPPSAWDKIYTSHQKANPTSFEISKLLPDVRGKSTVYDPWNQKIYYASNKGLFVASFHGVEEMHYKGNTIQARKMIWYNGSLIILQNSGILLGIDKNKNATEHPLFIGNELIAVNRVIRREQWLFMITNGRGVYVYDLDSKKPSIQLIDEIDRNEDISDIAIWKDKYVLTFSGGIMFMDIHNLKSRKNAPSFVINEITVNDMVLDTIKLSNLSPEQNNVSINYSILSYNTNLGYPLYYRINGGQWKLSYPDSRQLDLISLNPDEYVVDFRLGHTGDKPDKSVKFTIHHPLWELNWTWIAILAFTIGVLLLYMRWRIDRIKNKKT